MIQHDHIDVLTKDYSDIDQLREDAQGWQVEYDQVGRGRFRGQLQFFENDAFQFSRVRWNREVLFRGGTPKGTIGFALPLSPLAAEGRWAGVPAGNNDLMTQHAGSSGEFLAPENRDGMVASVPEYQARRTLSVLSEEGYGVAELMQGAYRLSDEAAAELRCLARQFSVALEDCEAGTLPAAIVHQMAAQLQKYILWRLVVASEKDFRPAYTQRADRVVADAEAFVRFCGEAYVGVLDICDAIGVSERTLHYAFSSTAGHSPAKWLRMKRLNEAHRRFVAAAPDELLVKQVALDLGFFHQGNFGICYKRQFGEKPSDTLARHPRNVPVLLPSTPVQGTC